MSDRPSSPGMDFLVTKQHRLFAEFCDACREYRYIGICYGGAGIGKTWSAAYYSRWDLIEPLPVHLNPRAVWTALPVSPRYLLDCRTILYTPDLANTPNKIMKHIEDLRVKLKYVVRNARLSQFENEQYQRREPEDCTELIIVDEADRLTMIGLEQMRDIYDKSQLGLIFIGMPGIEKRLSHYAQLYSRVGFVHQFNTLSHEEILTILKHKWQQLGIYFDPEDSTTKDAIAAIIATTRSNFRLVQHLFDQIQRVVRINHLSAIDKTVVETVRELLVMGTS